jgi:predicted RNase H-like HicB family nuclease
MRKIDLKSVVWKEGEFYVSQCLEVDVSSYGKTKKQALAMLQDALELYFAPS